MSRGFVRNVHLVWLRRSRALVIAGTVAAGLTAGAGAAVAGTAPQAGEQEISYLGLRPSVPNSWPVVDLSAGSTTCVRFDRHVVYLGTPGARQDCPAKLVGRTEALLVQPATSPTDTATSTEDTTSHDISVTGPTASVTATYDTDRAALTSVSASAGLPAPVPQARPRAGGVRPRATAGGFVSVFPDGVPLPNSSNLNFAEGQTIADMFGNHTSGGGQAHAGTTPTGCRTPATEPVHPRRNSARSRR
jgi:hypothetical protein